MDSRPAPSKLLLSFAVMVAAASVRSRVGSIRTYATSDWTCAGVRFGVGGIGEPDSPCTMAFASWSSVRAVTRRAGRFVECLAVGEIQRLLRELERRFAAE